jgi:hypothetical protein
MDTNLFLRTHRYLSAILNPGGKPDPMAIFGDMDLTLSVPHHLGGGLQIIEFDLDSDFQYGLSILLKMGIPLLSEIDFTDTFLGFVLESCEVDYWYDILKKPLPTVWRMDIMVAAAKAMPEDEMSDYVIEHLCSLVGMFNDLVCSINAFSEYESPVDSVPPVGVLGI